MLFNEDVQNKLPVLLRQYPRFDEDYILSLAQFDPTGKIGKYVPWMLKLANKGDLIFPEDGEKVRDVLDAFMIQVKSPEFRDPKDINAYKSFGDLAEVIEDNEGLTSKTLSKKISEKQGVNIIYDEDPYKIYKIATKEAAAKMCRHTKWCVKDPKYSTHYLNRGPLFMLVKNDEPYVLFHFETKDIKDVFDRPITKEIADEIYPIISQFNQFKKLDIDNATMEGDIVGFIIDNATELEIIGEYLDGDSGMLENWYAGSSIDKLKTTSLYDIISDIVEGLIESSIDMYDEVTYGSDEPQAQNSIFVLRDFSVFSNNYVNAFNEIKETCISKVLGQLKH